MHGDVQCTRPPHQTQMSSDQRVCSESAVKAICSSQTEHHTLRLCDHLQHVSLVHQSKLSLGTRLCSVSVVKRKMLATTQLLVRHHKRFVNLQVGVTRAVKSDMIACRGEDLLAPTGRLCSSPSGQVHKDAQVHLHQF